MSDDGCGYAGHEFGAQYPDSICVNGYLWDADSEEDGYLHSGGDIPCPSCNTEEYLQRALEEAKEGGSGLCMWTPWCAATAWEGAIRKATRENPDVVAEFLSRVEPFVTDDWPDRAAVRQRPELWQETVGRRWPWPMEGGGDAG